MHPSQCIQQCGALPPPGAPSPSCGSMNAQLCGHTMAQLHHSAPTNDNNSVTALELVYKIQRPSIAGELILLYHKKFCSNFRFVCARSPSPDRALRRHGEDNSTIEPIFHVSEWLRSSPNQGGPTDPLPQGRCLIHILRTESYRYCRGP
jgi:hypothetical protein